jgi:hypothetical protein
MDQRISADGIVIHQNKVLLVRHQRENASDFLVIPGSTSLNQQLPTRSDSCGTIIQNIFREWKITDKG